VGFFALIILFTLIGGVNVDMGSTIVGDGNAVVVRQNYFQVVRAATSAIFMSDERAVEFVEETNYRLKREFNEAGLCPSPWTKYGYDEHGNRDSNAIPPVVTIDDIAIIIQNIIDNGYNPNRINWVLYRYAFARAVMYLYTEDSVIIDPDLDHFRTSWAGNLATVLAGQAILRAAFSTMVIIVSLVMMIFAILAIVKKKAFSKVKLTFMMLTIASLCQIIANFNFMTLNWAWIMVIVFIFVFMLGYILVQHILMDDRDFSLSMFIHNAALLGGAILSFIFLTGPLFRVASQAGDGLSVLYGINLLYDLSAAQTAYISLVPMSYLLTIVVVMVILGLPFVMNVIFMLVLLSKFIRVDYTHNERRIMLSIFVAVNIIVFLILGISNIVVSDLYLSATPLWAIFVIQPLVVVGMLVFEILFKVKPIRKELVIN